MTAGDGHDGVGGRDSADRRDQAGSLVSPPGDLWWHAVFEASRDAIFISDGDSRFVAVNEAACLLTGYSRDELLRMRIPDLHDEVDLEAYRTHHSRIMTGEEALTRAAVRCRDGRKVEAEFSNRALTIDGHLFMHTVARDIGDRLAVERALQETTANLEALVENTDCAIWSVDADLRLVAGNSIFRDSVRRNLGRDLVPGESVLLEALSPDTRALWHALLSRALGGESFATELPTELQADLQVAEYRFSPIREASGKVTGATVFRRDVTERVRAEDALRLSEARFRDLVENLNEVVYIVQEDGAFTYLSPVIHGILGYEPEDLLGVPYTDLVHPDDVDRIRSDFALVLAGSPYVQEYRLRHRDGSYRWVRASSRSVVAEDGAVRVQGAAIDVTEWKREEEARRRTEEAFRTALENVTMVVVMLDVQGRVGFINDFALDLAGRTRDEALGGDWFELFIPAPSRDELRATFADTFSSGSFPAHYESPIVTRSGEERMVEWSNTVLRDPAGHVTRTVSFGEDVTERRRAVGALRKSEAHLTRAQELAHVGSWSFSPETGQPWWSREMFSIFGLDPGDGPPTYEQHRRLIHPDDWERFDAAVQLSLAQAVGYDLELRIVRPDGEERIVRSICAARTIGTGPPYALDGATQDITERQRTEAERLRLLGEIRMLGARLVAAEDAERKRLAHELHDRVGQGLTALGLTLDLARSTLPRDAAAEVGPRLEAAAALVGQTMAQVRDVMGALRPPMLDEYGLVPTLEWWSEQFGQRTGIGVEVRGAEPSPRLGIEVELPVFRVVQEALTNVARHSGASAATVTVAQGATAVTVEIADRGRGFDGARLTETGSGKSWGMAIMRERAFAVGAELAVDARPGHGTRVLVTVPR